MKPSPRPSPGVPGGRKTRTPLPRRSTICPRSARPARRPCGRSASTTLGDLLDYFPRDYQYESEEKPIDRLARRRDRNRARGSDGRQLHRRPRQAAIRGDAVTRARTAWPWSFSTAHISAGKFIRDCCCASADTFSFSAAYRRWPIPNGKSSMPTNQADRRCQAPRRLSGQRQAGQRNDRADHRGESGCGRRRPSANGSRRRLLAARKLMGRPQAYRAIHQPDGSPPGDRRPPPVGVRRADADAAWPGPEPAVEIGENQRPDRSDRQDAGPADSRAISIRIDRAASKTPSGRSSPI